MENLSLAEINQLLIDAGETVQVDSARFVQITASNEAQYEVIYGEDRKNHVFVYVLDGTYELSFSDFVEEEVVVAPPEV